MGSNENLVLFPNLWFEYDNANQRILLQLPLTYFWSPRRILLRKPARKKAKIKEGKKKKSVPRIWRLVSNPQTQWMLQVSHMKQMLSQWNFPVAKLIDHTQILANIYLEPNLCFWFSWQVHFLKTQQVFLRSIMHIRRSKEQ